MNAEIKAKLEEVIKEHLPQQVGELLQRDLAELAELRVEVTRLTKENQKLEELIIKKENSANKLNDEIKRLTSIIGDWESLRDSLETREKAVIAREKGIYRSDLRADAAEEKSPW